MNTLMMLLEKQMAALTMLVLFGLAVPVEAHVTPVEGDPPEAQSPPVRVVATLPVYAEVAEAIGGDLVEVSSIAASNQDAHFVRPKPSYALRLRQADLFITTGLDLELWVPTLLDKAGNSDVAEGGDGYVTAYTGIELLDIPESADRSAGDIHIYGNPHLHTDPLRALQIARNITSGLKKVAPGSADRFDRGLAEYADQTYRRLFGDRLVELLGGETLERLALNGNLMTFLRNEEFEGAPLMNQLGGWLGRAMPIRGKRIICYHKNWAYFEDRFGVVCADYIESKPGIPPTPRHVARLIDEMQSQGLDLILAANHFDRRKVERVAQRGGATPVIVPLYPGGSDDLDSYFAVVDHWIERLVEAASGGTE